MAAFLVYDCLLPSKAGQSAWQAGVLLQDSSVLLMSNFAIAMLQIKSVDYRSEDGKTVQSTRLPGYSGVSGLDAEQDAEDEKREAADLEAVCRRNNAY